MINPFLQSKWVVITLCTDIWRGLVVAKNSWDIEALGNLATISQTQINVGLQYLQYNKGRFGGFIQLACKSYCDVVKLCYTI